MKFRTKLSIGFGFFLVLFIVLLLILIMMMSQINQNMTNTVKNYEYSKLANTIQNSVYINSREARGLIANPPEKLRKSFQERKDKALADAEVAIKSLLQIDNREESQKLASELLTLLNHLREIEAEINELKREGKHEEAMELFWFDSWNIIDAMDKAAGELQKIQEASVEAELERSSETYSLAVILIVVYAIIGFLAFIFLLIWIVRSMTRNLNHVTSIMTSATFESVEKLPRIEVKSKDEIGAISVAYNRMAQAIEEYTKKEKELKNNAEEQSWLQTRIAKIATMYSGIDQLEQLAQKLMTKLTPMVGASFGIFYLKKKNESGERFEKLASYADSNQNIGKQSFQYGEGLVGQCALENKIIQIKEIPRDYIKITSGLGEAVPNYILTIPVAYEGEVLAVIELASFQSFTELEQALLKEVIGNIGINIQSIMRQNQVKVLLLESQSLTEELQTQSEELHVQQEELRAVHEQLEKQYEQSEQKTKELEKTKKMLEEKANQLSLSSKYKSEFLANMSHELRTPLNSLLILAQILADNAENNLTGTQMKYAKTIYSSGNDLLHLINDILDLAKVEAGKMDVHYDQVQIDEIIAFVEGKFNHVAQQKGIKFKVEMHPDLSSFVWTDKQRLQQILLNLLSNAFKFTEKGEVSLIIGRETGLVMAEEQVNDFVTFSVKDSGVGISIENLPAIFEAFNQADGTTSRKYGGTGLGLSISKEIARLLDGDIHVSSSKGIGSTFTLSIPNKDSIREQEIYDALNEVAVGISSENDLLSDQNELEKDVCIEHFEVEMSLKGKKVLVVDDDIRNIFAITAVLESREVEVDFAENGKEGIDRLIENPTIDLILMDIMMPEMDGLEAIKEIRKIDKFKDIPIIVLTAKAMKDDRKHCIEAGASDYISKPVDIEQLFSVMRVWLYPGLNKRK